MSKDPEELQDLSELSPEESLKLQASILGYDRMPAGIREFVNSDYYLGRMFGDGKLYDFWMEVLEKIFPTPIHTAYPFVIFTGPIEKLLYELKLNKI